MSALSSLVRAYERMAERKEVPPFGYARTEASFCIVLDAGGKPAFPPVDLRDSTGKKRIGRRLDLPTPLVQRTSGIASNFLWDKTAYSLGVTAGNAKRTAEEHQHFRNFHRTVLQGSHDHGLAAFLRFLDGWNPSMFDAFGWPEDMKDQNIVFALEEEYRERFLHQRAAAHTLWIDLYTQGEASEAGCLLTGEVGRVARCHSPIKGVWGSQSSGAFIVSFNATAFTSYGHVDGDNAPVSEAAAFAYTTALNRFLERGSRHRLQIGDASTVFWAEADNPQSATEAEDLFAAFTEGVDEEAASEKVRAVLDAIREGRPVADIAAHLPADVRFYVLGLSPNAARLSVRFYFEGDFGEIGRRWLEHIERLRVEPPPQETAPSMWRMLIETATLRKTENIQPNLAGEWLRAILAGAPYPLTLLSTLIMRMRADHDVNAMRVAILKSVLIRNFNRRVPVALDPTFDDPGYLLGRLFAVYEQIQLAAFDNKINATIKDKFYGAASSQPRRVFSYIAKNSTPHLSKLRKEKGGLMKYFENEIAEIKNLMVPEKDPFPAFLSDKSQAMFGLGYYHQRYRKAEKPASEEPAA